MDGIRRHNHRVARVAYGGIAACAAVLLAACSSSSSTTPPSGSTSSSPAAAPSSASAAATASSGSSASSTAAGVSALLADVNKYAAEPSFSDYGPNYGGKIPGIANLAGKKIMIIPGVSALAACEEIADAASDFAKAAGMVPTIFDNEGATADHNTAIENAIHQGYAAIIMGCAMDPSTSAPAIAQAQKAGIVVGVYGGTPDQDQRAGTTYNTDDPYALDATLAAEQAIEQHGGKPFHAIAITSLATGPATAIEEAAIKAELAKDDPGSTLTEVNVEVPQWQTQIASTVTAQLEKYPDANVLFPDYAGELTYVLAGIQAAHRTDVKTYLAFGGGTPFVQLQTASPGKDIIQSDVSESPPWTGYLLFLQAVRGLEKLPPISYDKAIGPDRIITPDNAVEVLNTGGFGDNWVNGFRELLGLPDLSGSALHAASTLNGAMVGKS
ncbi:MAG TPA: substrate-binding domain-containing protein [Trebonia sp.]|nr:substrate-binding domain-containing protein [Trebonia sp.]